MNRLIANSVRTAKTVSGGAYYKKNRGLRSNLLTKVLDIIFCQNWLRNKKGAFIGDGQLVRRGEVIWNESSRNNMQWSCMPGANAEVN